MDELVKAQLEHNEWAIEQLIQACEAVPLADFRRDFGIGFGTLERTLAHLIECMYCCVGLASGFRPR